MALSNYWFSPTLEIPAKFSTWCFLQSLVLNHAKLIAETLSGKLSTTQELNKYDNITFENECMKNKFIDYF